MNPWHRLARRLRFRLQRHRVEAEIAEEMRFHLEERAADFAADGLTAAEARRAAQRRFGNLASMQERARETWGWGGLERAAKDLRLALRQLARSPGFALLAIVTLGLGIGANTAMFGVLNTILLKPLPYADQDRLERVYRATPQNVEGNVSAADFLDLQREQSMYGEVAAYAPADASLAERGQPAEMASAARATPNLLSLLGVRPAQGRDFRPGEDQPGHDRVVLLSQRTWRHRFGGRPDIVGRSVRIDGEPHEVIGVLPPSFNDWRHLGWADFLRPLTFTPADAADRHDPRLRVIGRRSPERSSADAAGVIAGFGARLAAQFPAPHAETHWRTVPLHASAVGSGAPVSLGMLIGLSGFVLLIACSNLANLLLARTMARARELAVRAALGASRLQLLRPLVAEALVLALAGGVCAVLVAAWFGDWLAVRSTGDNGERVEFVLNGWVFGWAFAAALATAVAFGLAPALFALRLDLNDTLKSGGRSATASRAQQRFRQVLVVGQFALAMVLLAGAGLFVRGLQELNDRRAGWESTGLIGGTLRLPAARYAEAATLTRFQRVLLERLAAVPGVASVSLSTFPPYFDWTESRKILAEGRDSPPRGREPAALVNHVSRDYFATVGTRILAGRAFDERDGGDAGPVFVIGESAAAGLFGAENPLGRRLALGEGETLRWGEVVGVVADVASAVTDTSPIRFQVYRPLSQGARLQCQLAVRTTGAAPASLLADLRAALAELDPDLPVRDLRPADAAIARANYQLGVLRDMLGSFALLGLGLASLGVYGVIARTMADRSGEFAIRLALGARVRDVTTIVLTAGVKLALLGAALGFGGAVGVSRLLAANFPGLHLEGPVILAGTGLLLVGVALLACWLPARRVARLDPMAVLRAE